MNALLQPHIFQLIPYKTWLIYQSWLKKMPAESANIAQKGDFVLKIGIF